MSPIEILQLCVLVVMIIAGMALSCGLGYYHALKRYRPEMLSTHDPDSR